MTSDEEIPNDFAELKDAGEIFERTPEVLREILTGDKNDTSADLVFDETKQRAKYNDEYYKNNPDRAPFFSKDGYAGARAKREKSFEDIKEARKTEGHILDRKDRRILTGSVEQFRSFVSDVRKSVGEDAFKQWLDDPIYNLLDYKSKGRQLVKDKPIIDQSGEPVKTSDGKIATESVKMRGHTQYKFNPITDEDNEIDGHNILMGLLNPESLGSTNDRIVIGGHTEADIMNHGQEMGQWSYDGSDVFHGHGLKRQTNINPLHVYPIWKSENISEEREENARVKRDYQNVKRTREFKLVPNDPNVLHLYQTLAREANIMKSQGYSISNSKSNLLSGLGIALRGGKRTGGIAKNLLTRFQQAPLIDRPESFEDFLTGGGDVPQLQLDKDKKTFRVGLGSVSNYRDPVSRGIVPPVIRLKRRVN